MKTFIAIPCMDSVPIQFAQSLAVLNKDGECLVSCNVGSLIYESRNKLALNAIKAEADYVLWFDSDMQFAPDTMERLVKHMQDGKDIVSGLYFRRVQPFTPVIFKKLSLDKEGHCSFENYNDYPKETFEIAGCGFGCVMMKTSVLIDVFAKFGNAFCPVGNTGEDVAFCCRAREAGYKIYCDPTIKLGHCSHSVITEDFYYAFNGH